MNVLSTVSYPGFLGLVIAAKITLIKSQLFLIYNRENKTELVQICPVIKLKELCSLLSWDTQSNYHLSISLINGLVRLCLHPSVDGCKLLLIFIWDLYGRWKCDENKVFNEAAIALSPCPSWCYNSCKYASCLSGRQGLFYEFGVGPGTVRQLSTSGYLSVIVFLSSFSRFWRKLLSLLQQLVHEWLDYAGPDLVGLSLVWPQHL